MPDRSHVVCGYGVLLRSYHKDSNVFRPRCSPVTVIPTNSQSIRPEDVLASLAFVLLKNPIEEGEVYGYQEKYITIHIGYFPK